MERDCLDKQNPIISLSNYKILTLIKLIAFADDKFNATYIMTSLLDRVENFLEKKENAGYQHFLLFPQCFQKLSVSRSLNVRIAGKELCVCVC